MSDSPITCSELSGLLGIPMEGPDRTVTGLNDPRLAKEDELVILFDPAVLKYLESLNSRVWLVGDRLVTPSLRAQALRRSVTLLVSGHIHDDFVRLLRHFHPSAPEERSIHPTAVVEPSARLASDVHLGPWTFVGRNSLLERGVTVGALCSIGRNVTMGAESVLHDRVTLYDGTCLGERVVVHSGSTLGSDGFGYYNVATGPVKIPHVGRLVIEDDVEIGANCCVDRATLGETRIGSGTKIDNLVQIAHNVVIGANCLIASQVGIAGSTRIGDRVTIGGQAGLVGHITIGNGVTIGAQAGVIGSVNEGHTVSGYPARDHAEAMRRLAYVERIPDILRRLRELEKPR